MRTFLLDSIYHGDDDGDDMNCFFINQDVGRKLMELTVDIEAMSASCLQPASPFIPNVTLKCWAALIGSGDVPQSVLEIVQSPKLRGTTRCSVQSFTCSAAALSRNGNFPPAQRIPRASKKLMQVFFHTEIRNP